MLAPRRMMRVGRYSGVSLGIANLVSVIILTFLLWGFALPGHIHLFGVPDSRCSAFRRLPMKWSG